MPVPVRWGGRIVPIRLIPSGIAAADAPVIARPTIITTKLSPASAQISEPTSIAPTDTISIRRLPKRSPSRPKTGTAIAATSSVEVSSHWVPLVVLPRSAWISGRTGTIRVWVRATRTPQTAVIATAARSRAVQPSFSMPGGSRASAVEGRAAESAGSWKR